MLALNSEEYRCILTDLTEREDGSSVVEWQITVRIDEDGEFIYYRSEFGDFIGMRFKTVENKCITEKLITLMNGGEVPVWYTGKLTFDLNANDADVANEANDEVLVIFDKEEGYFFNKNGLREYLNNKYELESLLSQIIRLKLKRHALKDMP